MKARLLLTLCLFCTLTACRSVRTVYDENGNEVKEHQGGERSLEDYMQETFDKEVTRKKDDSGVPQSRSTKVSLYQKAIDEARKDDPHRLFVLLMGATTTMADALRAAPDIADKQVKQFVPIIF